MNFKEYMKEDKVISSNLDKMFKEYIKSLSNCYEISKKLRKNGRSEILKFKSEDDYNRFIDIIYNYFEGIDFIEDLKGKNIINTLLGIKK